MKAKVNIDLAKPNSDKTVFQIKTLDMMKSANTVLGFERTIIVIENVKPRLNMYKLYRDKSGNLQFREVGINASKTLQSPEQLC